MKYALCLIAIIAGTVRAAEPLPAQSQITEVTVYPDRAQITRTTEVQLPAGESRVALANLPVNLLDDSVRATGTAGQTVTIQDVETRRVVHERVRDEKAAELESKLEALRDQQTVLDARQRVLDQQREYVHQIQIKAAGDVSRDIQINRLDVAQLKDFQTYLGSDLSRLEEESRKITSERRELDRKIQATQADFNKSSAAATRAEKTAVVTVNAKEATKLRLQVSYVIGGASWTPSYDARAATDAGKVELTCNAVVRQQTGEDWRGVNLTLSTARPAVGARMPELTKWTVSYPEAVPLESEGVRRELSAPASPLPYNVSAKLALQEAADRVQESASVAAVPAVMSVEQATTSVSFRAPRAADVPSDGEPHRLSMASYALSAEFSYAATPRLSSFAYLKAAVTNTTDAPFLGGPVNVFMGPDFVGTGFIGLVPESAKFDLFLGVDEGVRIKREEIKAKRDKSGIFNKRNVQAFGYKLTVENYKDKPISVALYENLPVSANQEIKVALTDVSPKPTKNDEPTGKLTWELNVKPRDKAEISYGFTADWPQEKHVIGL